jgi:hypothetical protein
MAQRRSWQAFCRNNPDNDYSGVTDAQREQACASTLRVFRDYDYQTRDNIHEALERCGPQDTPVVMKYVCRGFRPSHLRTAGQLIGRQPPGAFTRNQRQYIIASQKLRELWYKAYQSQINRNTQQNNPSWLNPNRLPLAREPPPVGTGLRGRGRQLGTRHNVWAGGQWVMPKKRPLRAQPDEIAEWERQQAAAAAAAAAAGNGNAGAGAGLQRWNSLPWHLLQNGASNGGSRPPSRPPSRASSLRGNNSRPPSRPLSRASSFGNVLNENAQRNLEKALAARARRAPSTAAGANNFNALLAHAERTTANANLAALLASENAAGRALNAARAREARAARAGVRRTARARAQARAAEGQMREPVPGTNRAFVNTRPNNVTQRPLRT